MSTSYSTDQGRTWTRPHEGFISGAQQMLVVLPDSGLLISNRSHSWQQPGLYVTYDAGRSWNYAIAGPYSTYSAFLIGEDRIVVFAPHPVHEDVAALYHWVPSRQ